MYHLRSSGRSSRVLVFWCWTARYMHLSDLGIFLMTARIHTSRFVFCLFVFSFFFDKRILLCCKSLHSTSLHQLAGVKHFFSAYFTWKSLMQQGLLTHMVRDPPICSLTRYIQSLYSHFSGLLIGQKQIWLSSHWGNTEMPTMGTKPSLSKSQNEILSGRTRIKASLLPREGQQPNWLVPEAASLTSFRCPPSQRLFEFSPEHVLVPRRRAAFHTHSSNCYCFFSALPYAPQAHRIKFDFYTIFAGASFTINRGFKSKIGTTFLCQM